MKAIIFLVLLFVAFMAIAVEYTEDEKAKCADQGGCVTMTMNAIRNMAKTFFDKGHEAGVSQCRT